MNVEKLIDLLKRFDPESEVRLCVSLPGRVLQMHQHLWIGDYGDGPQINAALDFAPFTIYVGCGIEQFVRPLPEKPHILYVDLGEYDSDATLERVRDFYIYHKGLDLPLHEPDFDFEHWIPPRTVNGEYNQHISEILREKLLDND
jgi:hypothetical protein